MQQEVWKSKNINGVIYDISNYGNVKHNGKEIKTRLDKDGYLVCTAGSKKYRSMIKIHKIVAELFIPNPNNLPEINHKDFRRSNPYVENLEWCTHDYNVKYSHKYNKSKMKDNHGDNNPNAKLHSDDIIKIKEMLKYDNVANIARKYHVGWQTINHIKHNETWNII